MTEPWRLYGYWGSRDETALEIAIRLHRFFALVSDLGPNLGRWFRMGGLDRITYHKPAISGRSIEGLERRIARKMVRDDSGTLRATGGYHVGMWNREPDKSVIVSHVFAGRQSNPGVDFGLNKISFDFDRDLSSHGLDDDVRLKRFLGAVVHAWAPDWAVVFRTLPAALASIEQGKLFLDKMIWVGPARLAEADALGGEGVIVEDLAGGLLHTRLRPLDPGSGDGTSRAVRYRPFA